jgi:hypothetical protein
MKDFQREVLVVTLLLAALGAAVITYVWLVVKFAGG